MRKIQKRKPDFMIILIAVALLALTVFTYAGTYLGVFGFLAQRFDVLPAAAMALLLAFVFTSTCIILIMEREDPSRTLAWLIVLLAFPLVGFLIYVIFGQRLFRRQKVIRRLRRVQRQAGPVEQAPFSDEEGQFPPGSVKSRMSHLIYNGSGALLTWSNWAHVMNNGTNIFPAMLAAISGAKHHIHLESYIFRDDDLGRVFFDLLAEKAEAGVQVRIITDGVGSFGLGQARLDELEAQGIEVKIHFPIRVSLFRNRLNYRNHRKILVVDGRVGFVGGANIGNDYLSLYTDIGNWRDTQLLIHGSAAAELQRIFFQDWITISGELPSDNPGRFFPSFTEKDDWTPESALPDYPAALDRVMEVVAGTLPDNETIRPDLPRFTPVYNKAVQIAASGPDSPYASIMQAYHYAISNARDAINITSPYFVPNQSILTALRTAALAGVDINLLLPRNPDQQMVYLAAMTYLEDLMEDGVKVWLYSKGFLHSKIVTVDDTIAIVGTANMDQRSFTLNFEVGAIVYDKKIVEELNLTFQQDLTNATSLDLAAFKHRALYRKILESGCRLLSPLL